MTLLVNCRFWNSDLETKKVDLKKKFDLIKKLLLLDFLAGKKVRQSDKGQVTYVSMFIEQLWVWFSLFRVFEIFQLYIYSKLHSAQLLGEKVVPSLTKSEWSLSVCVWRLVRGRE